MIRTALLISFISALTVSVAHSANIECASISRGTSVPISQDAKNLAKYLKVKTCDGPRFEAIAKSKGVEVKKRQATEQEKTTYLTQDAKGFNF